jgi:hypothetical protein
MKKPRMSDGRNIRGDIIDPEAAARYDFAQGKRVDWRTTKERYEAEMARLLEETSK